MLCALRRRRSRAQEECRKRTREKSRKSKIGKRKEVADLGSEDEVSAHGVDHDGDPASDDDSEQYHLSHLDAVEAVRGVRQVCRETCASSVSAKVSPVRHVCDRV